MTALFLSAPYIDPRIVDYCRGKLKESTRKAGIDMVEANQPPEWAKSHESLYRNILDGLEKVKTDCVYICEHDCIYNWRYFSEGYTPFLSYSKNVKYLTKEGFIERNVGKNQGTLSTLYGNKHAIAEGIRDKLKELQAKGKLKWAEPYNGQPVRDATEIIDIRHGENFTGHRYGRTIGKTYATQIWNEIYG